MEAKYTYKEARCCALRINAVVMVARRRVSLGQLLALRWPKVAVAKGYLTSKAPGGLGQGDVTNCALHVGTPHDGLSLLLLGRPELVHPSWCQLAATFGSQPLSD